MSPQKFIWHGINDQGFKVSGEIFSASKEDASSYLSTDKITILRIKPKLSRTVSIRKYAVKSADITDFSVELCSLVHSGITLTHALAIMADNSANSAVKNLILALKIQLENGCLLSDALRTEPKYFDALFCNLVHAGEESGTLDEILKHIAQHRQKLAVLHKTIKKALYYPCIVLAIAAIVTSAMIVFVIPQFEQLFKNVGASLPAFTLDVLVVANFLRTYGLTLLISLLLVAVMIKIAIKYSARTQYQFDRIFLKLPIFGKILSQALLARCFRTLAILLTAGLPLLEALQAIAPITNNLVYQQAFEQITQRIKNGQFFHLALDNSKLFPKRCMQMISIGEESGRLDDMLGKLAEYFEERVDASVKNLSQLLEPAIMIFLSIIVGCLVIAMYLPIFRLGSVM